MPRKRMPASLFMFVKINFALPAKLSVISDTMQRRLGL